MNYLLLIIGLSILIFGADSLVKGGAQLARKFGLSSLIIGLTVVAFGTSAPELAVSISSAQTGQSEMAIANVIGSNIFNVLFILGLAAMITPLVISSQLIKQDVPIMLGLSLLVYYLAYDGIISAWNGVFLVVLLIGYLIFLFKQSKKDVNDVEINLNIPQESPSIWRSTFFVILGLGLLAFGAHVFVGSAVAIARSFGVSETIIGLTILAIGTSLPEIVTSVVASLKGERDIAVGNVVGSNTFNLLAVIGISSIVSGSGLNASEQILQLDFLVMIAAAVICLPLFFSGAKLNRVEGGVFFGLYLLYTLYLIGKAINASWSGALIDAFWYGAAPITLVVVFGTLVIDRKGRNQ